MMRILGKGLKFWKGCLAALVEGMKERGNCGKRNGLKYDIQNALTELFISMEQYAEPISTLVFRSKTSLITKIGLKNKEIGVVCLPPYWSQRGLFQRF
jgi:hypothetical protein